MKPTVVLPANTCPEFQTAKIVPMGKPRMTQRDKWKKRSCVERYHAFCDSLRAQVKAPASAGDVSWVAYFPMPKSWSKKRKAAMKGQPHRQRPDRDNIDKAILDALFKEDSGIYTGRLAKYWDDGQGARIEIRIGAVG